MKFRQALGSRDRGFIAETTYEMVRYKRLYAEIAEVKAPFDRQDLFRMWAVWAVLKGIKLPDWKQIEPTPERRIKGKFDELSKIRKYREAIPDWIDTICAKALGEKLWTAEIAGLNEKAEVILRTNTLKTSKEKLRKSLLDEGIVTEPIKGYTSALRLPERANVFQTESFKKGYFEVQDASSQLVAELLDVKAGQRVVDTCAGGGWKNAAIGCPHGKQGPIDRLGYLWEQIERTQTTC